jgi:uncharacterized membrane protein
MSELQKKEVLSPEEIIFEEEVMGDLVGVQEEVAVQESGLTPGDRAADFVAKSAGSWGFIISFLGFMGIWMVINSSKLVNFDPFPYILLNLVLSTIAAIQAPLIMMSQRRQDDRDRVRNIKAYELIITANNKVEQLEDQVKISNQMLKEINRKL